MNNIIYIVSKNVSLAEEEAIKKVFGYAGIGPELLKVVDINSDSFNVSGKSIFLCFNETSTKVTMPLSKERGYPGHVFIKDLVDDENKVAVCILTEPISHYAMPHCLSSDKAMLWRCVLTLSDKLKEWYPSLVQYSSAGQAQEAVEQPKTEAPQEGPKNEEIKPHEAQVEQTYTRAPDAPTTFSVAQETEVPSIISFSVDEMIDRMIDSMKLSDPGLGKSLKLIDSVVLESVNGHRITVHPNNVVKEPSNGMHISFKDMCSLVKLALISDSKKIQFILRRD